LNARCHGAPETPNVREVSHAGHWLSTAKMEPMAAPAMAPENVGNRFHGFRNQKCLRL
jgi:hypothetical protein